MVISFLFNMLNIAAINSYVIYLDNKRNQRYQFLITLQQQLTVEMQEHVNTRAHAENTALPLFK